MRSASGSYLRLSLHTLTHSPRPHQQATALLASILVRCDLQTAILLSSMAILVVHRELSILVVLRLLHESMHSCTFLVLRHSGFDLQLPASFFAYRKQQHRWTCGPVQLWRKASSDIWNSSLPMSRKLELICCYFGVRKFATHWVSLGFFCGLVPLSIFTPEVSGSCCLQSP